MRRRAPILALAAVLAAIALCASAPASQAASSLAFVSCPGSAGFGCTTVNVPLDRTGALPGTVPLSVERKLAGAEPSRDAVLALAGGPGQATLPLDEFIAQAIAPALSSRDLLLFDQRGTGASDPLSCSAFEEPVGRQTLGHLFEQCALDIGPARGAFTTQESVDDIEALRSAAGYEKLVLYGTSYGTKVALEYAADATPARRGARARLGRSRQRPRTVPAADAPGDRADARGALWQRGLRRDQREPALPNSRGSPPGCAGTRCSAPSTTAPADATPPAWARAVCSRSCRRAT